MGDRIPGHQCQGTKPECVKDGGTALASTPRSGPDLKPKGHTPLALRTPARPRSILEIRPGQASNTYPATLSVEDYLIQALRELQQDNKVPDELIPDKKAQPVMIMERAAIISKTGVLFSLSKEKHIELEGARESQGTSPNVEKTFTALLAQESDPTAKMGEIYVHTHPSFSAPSEADIGLAARHLKSVLMPSKSMVVGAKYIFLMIPTRETWSMSPSSIWSTVASVPPPPQEKQGGKIGEVLEQGSIKNAIAEVKALHMHIYNFDEDDGVFHRQ